MYNRGLFQVISGSELYFSDLVARLGAAGNGYASSLRGKTCLERIMPSLEQHLEPLAIAATLDLMIPPKINPRHSGNRGVR
jgi:hypothetical protein